MDERLMYIYALGYFDGRSTGNEENLYSDNEDRNAYSLGYERGVSDYIELRDSKLRDDIDRHYAAGYAYACGYHD